MINTELLGQGAVVCVIGLATVFIVLAILWGVLELMHVIFAPKPETEDQQGKPAEEPLLKTDPAQAPAAAAVAEADEDELVAVLTAAVAASLGTSTYHLKIRSYRQIGSTAPAWNAAARRENLSGR